MKIVHVSFAVIKNYDHPETFLKAIQYFTGILDEQALKHSVISLYTHQHACEIRRNGVLYKFFSPSSDRNLVPFKMCRYVRSELPDIIIVHGLHFSVQIMQLRMWVGSRPIIYVQHHAERPLKSLRKIIQKLNDQFVRGYFFCSSEIGKEWIDKKLISDKAKIHEVMEVSSTFTAVPKHTARNLLALSNENIYLWVGRLDKNKDPETLVKAFVAFSKVKSDAKLFVAFQSNEQIDKISRDIAAIADKIVLLGRLDHDQLTQWYSAADFIISTSQYEGSGLAVCEAMSCGCVPILSNIPSFRMMTGFGDCGLLFEPGNSNSLLGALQKSAAIDVGKVSEQSRLRFENYLSFSAIARKIDEVIQHDSATS
jgi:glycosyltransferase involved in cell wall biosynthesis